MFIISGSRVLTQAIFHLDVGITHDEYGREIVPRRLNAGYIALDATGSMNSSDVAIACATMIHKAAAHMGRDLGVGWHDVL